MDHLPPRHAGAQDRRLRAAGKIPATLYGAQKAGDQPAPESVSIDPKPFLRILHSKSGFNTLITLKLQGKAATEAKPAA